MKQRLWALALLCLMATGCAKNAKSHPGSISGLDSHVYDVLLVEQDVLNQAKTDYQAGNLPVGSKDALNYAIKQYNLLHEQWTVYHASGSNATELQQALDALTTAMGQLNTLLGKKPAPSKPVTLFFSPRFDQPYAMEAL